MLIDSYEDPGAESLLLLGRGRHSDGGAARRLLITEAAGAAIFIAAATALALVADSPRSLSPWALTIAVVTYVIARRVQYPVGSAWTAPTQLVFVPMLFVLPTPVVPLVVAACSVLERLPSVVRGHLGPTRLLAAVGDSFYALGPALVLVAFNAQTFTWRHWPVFVLAFAAQAAFDAGAGFARTWFAERVRPSGQLPMLWLYVTDACLSCVGLLLAASAATRPGLMLLALPLVGLMGLLARERQQRLEYSLALTGAYRRTATLLAQSQSLTQELQQQSEELHQTNDELHEKARLLARQNRDIELKNEEIELARRGLEEKAAQLALSSKYKSEFLANVSHELRTPLNSMLLLSRLLAENADDRLSEREIEFAQTIHSAGDDLLSLINDILDLSKVEAGRMELDFAPLALSDVCADADRAFRHIADDKGLSFAVEVDPALSGSIVSDRQRLGQVLKNLLANAFKFTHEGGVRLSIGQAATRAEVRSDALRSAERVIEFSVTDTGVGIPDDKLNLIFEAFQQADGSTSRKYGGTGLGLSISREIARLLGGEIQVESVLGLGSRFSLLIPATQDGSSRQIEPPAPAAVSVAPAAVEPRVSDDRTSMRPGEQAVLVIDANGERAIAMLEVLHSRGEKAIVAAETTAAVELAREHQPKAVLLAGDAKRVESGIAELKRHPDTRHLPIVAVGGLAARLPTLRLGAVAFVERSIDAAELDLAMSRVDAVTGTLARRVALVAHPSGFERLANVLRSIGEVEVVRIDPDTASLALRTEPYDLAVMSLDRREIDPFSTLRSLVTEEVVRDLPLIAYVPGELSRLERARLDAVAKAAVIAVIDSPELLADRATLYLHRAPGTLPKSMRGLLSRASTDAALLHGKKVLVIDDDIRSGFALTSMLEQYGMKVVYAENGREGIERLHQHANTDLVLLDIMMPEMNGYETAQAIRATPGLEHLPIISLTAKALEGDKDKALASGASDYIAKPVDVDQLITLMRAWLGAGEPVRSA
ncbi:MAG TPA: response regulator [Solirubrobacteraceae bacterium]|nr:response regulator [Solirubrobacteraceae bacterium]